MSDRSQYCFMHNIKFETSALHDQHKVECEDQLGQLNVCKQYSENGSMCGKSFKSFMALYDHSHQVHKVIICEFCDAQSKYIGVMNQHYHKAKNIKSIHASKWNIYIYT